MGPQGGQSNYVLKAATSAQITAREERHLTALSVNFRKTSEPFVPATNLG
jgi:hypothetical protein